MSQYQQLQSIVAPVVEGEGFEFWGLEHQALKSGALLRVFIESENGVSVDDCARVSRELSVVLDVEDPISTEYRLEISSPGMARKFFDLKQYGAYTGHLVKIRLNTLFEGRRKFTGIIRTVDIENSELGVVVDDEEILLPYELIERGQLVPQYS